jgi:hypothetical protein
LSADAGDAEASRVRTRDKPIAWQRSAKLLRSNDVFTSAVQHCKRNSAGLFLAYARPRRPGFRSPRMSKRDATLIFDSGHARRMADVPDGSALSSSKTTTRSPHHREHCAASLTSARMKERIPETVGDKPDWRFHHYCRQYSRLDLLNLGPFNNQSYYVGRPKARRASQLQPCSGPQSRRFDGFPGKTAS